jgi:hypothetical protein
MLSPHGAAALARGHDADKIVSPPCVGRLRDDRPAGHWIFQCLAQKGDLLAEGHGAEKVAHLGAFEDGAKVSPVAMGNEFFQCAATTTATIVAAAAAVAAAVFHGLVVVAAEHAALCHSLLGRRAQHIPYHPSLDALGKADRSRVRRSVPLLEPFDNATQHLDAVLQWDRVEGIREARVVVAAAEKIAPLDLLRPSRLGKGFAQGTHEFALIRELLDKAVVSVGRVWRAGGDKQSV